MPIYLNSIDFHGYTIDEVSGRLTNFLVSFKHGRDSEATIVVGKGEVVRPYVIGEVERANIKSSFWLIMIALYK